MADDLLQILFVHLNADERIVEAEAHIVEAQLAQGNFPLMNAVQQVKVQPRPRRAAGVAMQGAAGLSEVTSPSFRDNSRTWGLVMPSSRRGLLILSSFRAASPGRYSAVSLWLLPSKT